MNIPKTTWQWSKESEAQRVVFTATQTANRFYSTHGFWVLPELVKGNSRAVYLPKLEYSNVNNFWKRVAKLDAAKLVVEKHSLALKIEPLLLNIEPKYQLLERKWVKVEEDFWTAIEEMFPIFKKKEIALIIMPTKYGTGSSHSKTPGTA